MHTPGKAGERSGGQKVGYMLIWFSSLHAELQFEKRLKKRLSVCGLHIGSTHGLVGFLFP